MKETDLSFFVKGKKVVGTLSLPDSDTKAPVVLLIHGFTGNRHESVSKHQRVNLPYLPQNCLKLALLLYVLICVEVAKVQDH